MLMTTNPELQEAVDTFIQGAGKVSSGLLGMVNKVGGQIYALLFLSQEPLSLDNIAERLEISKGNVSINVRMLEDYKLVKKVWVKEIVRPARIGSWKVLFQMLFHLNLG